MAFNYTQKRFMGLMLIVALLVAAIYLLIAVFPDVGKYVYIAVMAVVGIFILYVSFAPLVGLLSEHADIILQVNPDESGLGLHIFSAYSVSRYKIARPPIRYIQHYFIVAATGKKYYKVLFSHEQRPIAGQSGYTGYTSFENSVLESAALEASMEAFSTKTNMQLRLGKPVGGSEEEHYTIHVGDHRVEIKKCPGIFDDIFKVSGYSAKSGKLEWKKRL